MNRKLVYIVAVMAMTLAACAAEDRAKEMGLVPEAPPEVARTERADDTLAHMRAVLNRGTSELMRPLPPMPPPVIIEEIEAGVPDDNEVWTSALVDATNFDTLANSMNQISAALPEERGKVFDAAIKTLLFQVNLDPEIVKKASANITPTDVDILRATQRLVHGKTPYQIVSEAYILSQERELQKRIPRTTVPVRPAADAAAAMGGAQPGPQPEGYPGLQP